MFALVLSMLTWFFTNKNKPYSSVSLTFIICQNLLVVLTYFKQDSVILIRFSKPVELGNLYAFILTCKEQFPVFGWIDVICDKYFSKMPKFHILCIHILLVTWGYLQSWQPFQNIKIKIIHANFLENFVRISEFSSKWIVISGILSEYKKVNYTKRYGSLLKMKNHVSI